MLDTITSIGAAVDGVQFFYPWSTERFTLERHLIHGPFSELFYVILPLIGITRLVCYRRNFAWPKPAREQPSSLIR